MRIHLNLLISLIQMVAIDAAENIISRRVSNDTRSGYRSKL